jgi:hypothetical protein
MSEHEIASDYKLKHLQPSQYVAWLTRASDPEWEDDDNPRSRPERAAASFALELRDVIERCSKAEARVAQLETALKQPAEQCENCDEYYADSVMRKTSDEVPLCPKCWDELCQYLEDGRWS